MNRKFIEVKSELYSGVIQIRLNSVFDLHQYISDKAHIGTGISVISHANKVNFRDHDEWTFTCSSIDDYLMVKNEIYYFEKRKKDMHQYYLDYPKKNKSYKKELKFNKKERDSYKDQIKRYKSEKIIFQFKEDIDIKKMRYKHRDLSNFEFWCYLSIYGIRKIPILKFIIGMIPIDLLLYDN